MGKKGRPDELPAKDDWAYLGKWVARKLDMDPNSSIYDVMGQMHCVVGGDQSYRDFIAKQKVHNTQREEAELIHLRRVVAGLNAETTP